MLECSLAFLDQEGCEVPFGGSTCVDMLCVGVNYSAAGCEFTVNDLTIYIKYIVFNWKTRKTRLCIDWLTKIL